MVYQIGINGVGRIGAKLIRVAAARGEIARIAAVNDPYFSPKDIALKLKYDSVHGKYPGNIAHTKDSVVIDGHPILVSKYEKPEHVPWANFGDLIIAECTGAFTSRDKAAGHLIGGAKRVVISSPGEGVDKTFVLGINDREYIPGKHNIVSNASCTTNCLAPLVH